MPEKFQTLRLQTVHWLGAKFFVCTLLVSRDKYSKMFQMLVIPRTTSCNVNFAGTFVSLRTLQQAILKLAFLAFAFVGRFRKILV